MDNELDPIVGNWYRYVGKGDLFRVVAVDEDRDVLEVQHFDGDIEQLDLSGWFDLDVELTEAPEDWTGPVDAVETDDLGYSETTMRAADWRAPLESAKAVDEDEDWEDEDEDDDDWDDEDEDSSDASYD